MGERADEPLIKAETREAQLRGRRAPIDLDTEELRSAGHRTVDAIANFFSELSKRPVTPGEKPSAVRSALGTGGLPPRGTAPEELIEQACRLLFEHSLLNGHPRFFGYITSSAAPIGALGDLLAAAVNPNLGAWALSPLATEMELQTVKWIAELIGYPESCGGLLVSGGNMANFVCFLAARRARAGWEIREEGLRGHPQLTLYVSEETHTWIQKASDLFGLGTQAIRWIPVDGEHRLDPAALERQIVSDRAAGFSPLLAVGTAGTVALGAVDPLPAMAQVCRRQGLWLHVDGAYGAAAAVLPEASEDLKGLALADSVAIDPHKWLYAPLEAGCALVADPRHLVEAFSFHPDYYNFDSLDEEARLNLHEYGPQNSRGFRALKVWLGLKQVGRDGYVQMIRDDCELAQALFEAVGRREDLEAVTRSLSITTFRFVPTDLREQSAAPGVAEYLNELNGSLLTRLQEGGEAFLSNAVVEGKFLLRACIVNFRTTLADVESLIEIVARQGREVDGEKRPGSLRDNPRP